MRTTVDLDDDVLKGVDETARREGRSRKEILNETIRLGLRRREGTAEPQRDPTEPQDLGRCLLPTLDDTAEVLAVAEREDYR